MGEDSWRRTRMLYGVSVFEAQLKKTAWNLLGDEDQNAIWYAVYGELEEAFKRNEEDRALTGSQTLMPWQRSADAAIRVVFERQRHLFTWDHLPEVREMFADVKARVAADLSEKGLMNQPYNRHDHPQHSISHQLLPPPPPLPQSASGSSSSASPSLSLTEASSVSTTTTTTSANKCLALLEHCVSEYPGESEVWELLTYDGPHREKWIDSVDRWTEHPPNSAGHALGSVRSRGRGGAYHKGVGATRGCRGHRARARRSTWR